MRHPLRLLAATLLAVMVAGAASSCSTPRAGSGSSVPAAAQQPVAPVRAAAGVLIAQLDHGRPAIFATCAPPNCPVVTPKTLAAEPSLAARPATRADTNPGPSVAPPQSLRPGETLVIAAAHAPLAPAQRFAIRPEVKTEPLVSEVVVNFSFGSAALTAAARASIDVAAAGDGIRRIDIRGRTDNVGPPATNNLLARRRAAAVLQYLRARHLHLAGAAANVDARGGCCYATENDTPEGRASNRRVEIVFERLPTDP